MTWETGYGDDQEVFVLPNGVALVAAWQGDNTGPAPIDAIQQVYASLRKRYPHATVRPASFDEFFAIANQPDVKSQLPVVTQDIGLFRKKTNKGERRRKEKEEGRGRGMKEKNVI